MQIFRVDEYIEGRPTGRYWDVSATNVFEAVDSAWWMQITSRAPRGDLIPIAVGPADDPATVPSAGVCATEHLPRDPHVLVAIAE